MFLLFFTIVGCGITGAFCVLISKYFVSKQYILKDVNNDKETKIIGNYIDIKCGEEYAHFFKKTQDSWYYVLNDETEKKLKYNEDIMIGNRIFKIIVKNKTDMLSAFIPAIIYLITIIFSFLQSCFIMNSEGETINSEQVKSNIEKVIYNGNVDSDIQIINNSEINEIVLENDNIFQYKTSVNWSLCHNENGRFLFEDIPSETGISVSVYQGEIDWRKVKLDEIDYAIIRIGSRGYETGNLYLDSRFSENMDEAKANNIKVGAYFYSQAINQKEVDEEIEMILDTLKEYTLDYPIGIGLERKDGYRTNDLTDDEYEDLIKYFCIRIKQNGYIPMIMGKDEWFSGFPEGTFDGYLKLVTNVNTPPQNIDNCIIWEYQENAKNMVNGVNQVELSVSIFTNNQDN